LTNELDVLRETDLFDEAWYLKQYPDVRMLGLDPAKHFIEFGGKLQRNPSPYFCVRTYYRENPDLRDQNQNPLVHYILTGEREGRALPASPEWVTRLGLKRLGLRPRWFDAYPALLAPSPKRHQLEDVGRPDILNNSDNYWYELDLEDVSKSAEAWEDRRVLFIGTCFDLGDKRGTTALHLMNVLVANGHLDLSSLNINMQTRERELGSILRAKNVIFVDGLNPFFVYPSLLRLIETEFEGEIVVFIDETKEELSLIKEKFPDLLQTIISNKHIYNYAYASNQQMSFAHDQLGLPSGIVIGRVGGIQSILERPPKTDDSFGETPNLLCVYCGVDQELADVVESWEDWFPQSKIPCRITPLDIHRLAKSEPKAEKIIDQKLSGFDGIIVCDMDEGCPSIVLDALKGGKPIAISTQAQLCELIRHEFKDRIIECNLNSKAQLIESVSLLYEYINVPRPDYNKKVFSPAYMVKKLGVLFKNIKINTSSEEIVVCSRSKKKLLVLAAYEQDNQEEVLELLFSFRKYINKIKFVSMGKRPMDTPNTRVLLGCDLEVEFLEYDDCKSSLAKCAGLNTGELIAVFTTQASLKNGAKMLSSRSAAERVFSSFISYESLGGVYEMNEGPEDGNWVSLMGRAEVLNELVNSDVLWEVASNSFFEKRLVFRYLDNEATPLRLLKNSKLGEDIYVVAAGASGDFLKAEFFEEKCVIGVNRVFEHFPCNYAVFKEFSSQRAEAVADMLGVIEVVARGQFGIGVSAGGNSNTAIFSSSECVFFDHDNNSTDTIKLTSIAKNSDKLVVSDSTITTAMHLAAYLGAENIILVGHDCGTLDGMATLKSYYQSENHIYQGSFEDYYSWLREIEGQTILVKEALKSKFGCNVYSLNPFINFGLEGHVYQ